jgi:hypothetical protein
MEPRFKTLKSVESHYFSISRFWTNFQKLTQKHGGAGYTRYLAPVWKAQSSLYDVLVDGLRGWRRTQRKTLGAAAIDIYLLEHADAIRAGVIAFEQALEPLDDARGLHADFAVLLDETWAAVAGLWSLDLLEDEAVEIARASPVVAVPQYSEPVERLRTQLCELLNLPQETAQPSKLSPLAAQDRAKEEDAPELPAITAEEAPGLVEAVCAWLDGAL